MWVGLGIGLGMWWMVVATILICGGVLLTERGGGEIVFGQLLPGVGDDKLGMKSLGGDVAVVVMVPGELLMMGGGRWIRCLVVGGGGGVVGLFVCLFDRFGDRGNDDANDMRLDGDNGEDNEEEEGEGGEDEWVVVGLLWVYWSMM